MSRTTLRMLLWALGVAMTQASRFMPSLRAQVTRTLTFELSAGDEVARHWSFEAPTRRIRSRPGPATNPECSVHFDTSAQALRALVSRHTVDRFVAALQEGTAQITGSAFVLLWFHGLTRKFVKLGSNAGPTYGLPGRYLAHDPTAAGNETIIIEPAVTRLDPTWTAAWRARATLLQIRSTTDEPVLEP